MESVQCISIAYGEVHIGLTEISQQLSRVQGEPKKCPNTKITISQKCVNIFVPNCTAQKIDVIKVSSIDRPVPPLLRRQCNVILMSKFRMLVNVLIF